MAITDNLLAYWNLNQSGAAGTVITDSTGTYDSTDISGATYDAGGKIDGCYVFDGTDDVISFGQNNALQLSGTAYSISAWINGNSFGVSENQINVIYGAIGGGGTNGVSFNVHSGGWLSIYPGGGALKGEIEISENVWHHVVVTSNGSETLLYVDNTYDLSGTVQVVKSGTAYDTIGAVIVGGVFWEFTGSIDELGVWDRQITVDEINTLYNGGDGLTYPFAVVGDGWYPHKIIGTQTQKIIGITSSGVSGVTGVY